MASLLQIASILAERASKKTDKSFIRQMEDLVVIERARIIANSLSKISSIDKYYLNAFHAPLKKVDITDECSTELEDLDCADEAYRTVDLVPEPIRYSGNLFTYVGAPGGAKAYGWTTFGNEPFMKASKLTGKNARWNYVNGYIYIFNKEIDKIRVEGVFGDPRELKKFQSCDGTKPCFSEESEMFVDEQNAKLIINEILGTHLRLLPQNEKILIKEDKNV